MSSIPADIPHVYGAIPGASGGPVSASSVERAKKETWADWLPPDAPAPTELMTRDELLTRLREEGLAVSRDNLRDWQSAGVTPYGINRWHEGATRTLYASWVVNVIRTLRAMQADGHKLPEIRDALRRTTFWPVTFHPPAATATAEASPPTLHTAPQSAAIAVLPDDLAARLIAFARQHEETFGARIVRVDVRLVDENGIPLAFRINTHHTE